MVKGLDEAIEYEQGTIKARRHSITVVPPEELTAAQIKQIRNEAGMTQALFAEFLGVSPKTVEAWERGRNRPDGPARRVMGLLKEDAKFAEKHHLIVMG